EARVVQRVGEPSPVALGPNKDQALVVLCLGRVHVALPVRDAAGRLQRASLLAWVFAGAPHRKGRFQTGLALAEVAAHLPEAPEGGAEGERAPGISSRDCPVERCPEVVVVELEPVEPLLPVRAEQLGSGSLR